MNIIVIREILGNKKTKLHNIIHYSAVKVVLFLSLNFTVVVKSLLFSTMVFYCETTHTYIIQLHKWLGKLLFLSIFKKVSVKNVYSIIDLQALHSIIQ